MGDRKKWIHDSSHFQTGIVFMYGTYHFLNRDVSAAHYRKYGRPDKGLCRKKASKRNVQALQLQNTAS